MKDEQYNNTVMSESLAEPKKSDHMRVSRANQLQTLLKNLPGMSYRCLNLQHWPMDFVSEGCFDLCGYRRHEIESQSVLWGDFTHPEDVEEVDRLVRLACDSGESFEVEYRIISKSGTTKWVWERGRPVNARSDGVAIIEGFITDITDRKLSEAALVDAKAYADAIVESAAEGIITIDSSGRIESLNLAAQRIFGYSLNKILGKHCQVLVTDEFNFQLSEYFSSKNYQTEETTKHHCQNRTGSHLNLESTGIKGDGTKFPMQCSLNRITGSIDNKSVMLIRDLTAVRNAESDAREQRELLAHAERLNTLGEMAAVTAHEINQPLTAISMYAKSGLSFIQNSSSEEHRLVSALEGISTQARRAGAIMERMQFMTRRRESVRNIVNPSVLLSEAHALAEVEARIRNFVITLQLDDGLPNICCDTVQIQQVILNLLRNGMESMTLAGRSANSEIILLATRQSNGIVVAIDDCGFGISPDLSKQLYKAFVTTKNAGMGLGLSISHSIISSHGGTLTHKNNKRGGATFSFEMYSEEAISSITGD